MKLFLYTFYTWLLANLLHPLFFFFLLLALGDHAQPYWNEGAIWLLFIFIIVCMACSLPCLIAGWLCMYVIRHTTYLPYAKFLVWLVAAPLLVFFEFLFIGVIADEMEAIILLLMLPSIAAVITAIVIRYSAFAKSICPAGLPVAENAGML